MSKAKLKKELQKLTKEQLIEQLLELYNAYKPVKEFFEFYLDPNEQAAIEPYRKRIIQEFYPGTKTMWEPKLRFSEAKKAIAEFAALKPSPELMADLLMTLPETACRFTHDFGDISEQYYTSCENNYERALAYLQKHGLLEALQHRAEQCLKYVSSCGYGFPDEMNEIFERYYQG